MNILTFDTEEWYIEKVLHGGRTFKYKQFDETFHKLLDVLDQHELKGTFFCLGKLAEEFPYVLKQIVDRGHEIGCHSHQHQWLNRMTAEEFREDTRSAIDALQQLTGKKVLSYRAPAFTIGESNKWAIEVLAECGIENDASIFPTRRAFGGFSSFGEATPCFIHYGGVKLREFPVCITSILGEKMVFSGGGYFRVFPYCFLNYQMTHRDYTIWYFHLNDLISEQRKLLSREQYENYYREPGTLLNRYMRYFKTSIGSAGAFDKMTKLLDKASFVNIRHAVETIDWSKVKTVYL